MCNLYSQTKTRETVGKLFKVNHNRSVAIEQQDAIFPSNGAAIVKCADAVSSTYTVKHLTSIGGAKKHSCATLLKRYINSKKGSILASSISARRPVKSPSASIARSVSSG